MTRYEREELASFILKALFVVGCFAVMPFLSVLAGAFVGWAVGLFFEQTIMTTIARTGANIKGLQMWELGAMLGFIGGFIRPHIPMRKG